MAKFEYRFPELGEGLHEGEIVKVCISVGQTVTDDDVIMEVQNDKAVVEVPCPVNGKVVEIFMKDGDVKKVGEVVAIIDAEGELPEQAGGHEEAAPAATPAPAAQASGVVNFEYKFPELGEGLHEGEIVKVNITVGQTVTDEDIIMEVQNDKAVVEVPCPVNGKVISVFMKDGDVKKVGEVVAVIAAEGDLPEQAGGNEASAPAASAPAAAAPKAAAPAAKAAPAATNAFRPEERVPFKGIRKVIAGAMSKSVYTAPHVTIMDEVDVTELVALRAKYKPYAEKKGSKLTYLPFIVKALVSACREFPIMNAMLDEASQEIVYKKFYNVGIATDTENGLIVPVIEDADRKNLFGIADTIKDLAIRGRDGKLAANELRGSTITISNIGSAGGMFFTPVINFPEVAILGTGRISEKAVVRNGEIVVAPVMALSLSFDHRLIDGATAQNFMNHIKKLLAQPELFIMEV